jgi:hypothetical protein
MPAERLLQTFKTLLTEQCDGNAPTLEACLGVQFFPALYRKPTRSPYEQGFSALSDRLEKFRYAALRPFTRMQSR